MNWLYSRKISIVVFSFIITAFAVFCIVAFAGLVKPVETKISTLEKMAGTKGEMSEGYNHGEVFSIDGQKIASDVTGTVKNEDGNEWEQTIHCADYGFSSIIGADGRGGLIKSCHQTLQSSANKVNRKYSTGNSIITTLSYNGQRRASELLSENFSDDVCDSASVCVVLRDGAVLVAAGLNEYETSAFFESTPPDSLYIDYTAMNMPVGSVAKAITARMLLLKNNLLSEEDSLYNNEYTDVSHYQSADGTTIHNWDWQIPEQYEQFLENGVMIRYSSLSDALRNSSNTYFWRHALALGLEESYAYENELFAIASPIVTDINTLDKTEKKRLDYFFWGQDYNSSPTRLCQIYNHVLSGEAYTPFYIASVRLPDNTEIYRAEPKSRKELNFKVAKDDILKEGLCECFEYYAQGIDSSILSEYQNMIDNRQFLAKSGTADKDEKSGTTNNTRILTALDENHEVVASACILVENAVPGAVNDNIMFSILFGTLEAAGVI